VWSSPFFRRLFLPYLLLSCAAIGVVGLVGAQQLRDSYLRQARRSLGDETQLLALSVSGDLHPDRQAELRDHVNQAGQAIGRRVTIVAEEGTVIADNEADPAAMENHRLRPEIITATTRGHGESIRPSDTIHTDMMYFARRVDGADGKPYYLRLSLHLLDLDRQLRAFYAGIAAAALLAMLGAAGISYYFARRSTRPLLELIQFADAIRHGNLSRRIIRPEIGDLGTLAAALNAMADSLVDLLHQSQRDKSQLLAILSGMNEGVIATNTQQRVVLSNQAAARLLDASLEEAVGRPLWEVIRHQAILQAASDVLLGSQRQGLRIGAIAGRQLQVTIRTFPALGTPEGLVIVLHDATEAIRYEELRTEFVANVSHELRTPLTAIKGFAETLREGAMQDPQRGPQYLATIEKHADQLTNLVSDLLDLSSMESLPGVPRPEHVDLEQVARKAVELFQSAAQRKQQQLHIEVWPHLPHVDGNADYLQRAIANLIDNALKYTPEGGVVRLSVKQDNSALSVEVSDNGIGIPADDLPRIFERFYRVDRSRSRDMGGTGLGLSIVKHIVQAHRGTIEVSSKPGQGTRFVMRFPRASLTASDASASD